MGAKTLCSVAEDTSFEEVLEVLAIELRDLVLGTGDDGVRELVERVEERSDGELGPTFVVGRDAVDADTTVLGLVWARVGGEVEEAESLVCVLGEDVGGAPLSKGTRLGRSRSTRRCSVGPGNVVARRRH